MRKQNGQIERRVKPVKLRAGEGFVVHTYSGSLERPAGTAPAFRFEVPTDRVLPEVVWGALRADLRVLLAAGNGDSAEPSAVLD